MKGSQATWNDSPIQQASDDPKLDFNIVRAIFTIYISRYSLEIPACSHIYGVVPPIFLTFQPFVTEWHCRKHQDRKVCQLMNRYFNQDRMQIASCTLQNYIVQIALSIRSFQERPHLRAASGLSMPQSALARISTSQLPRKGLFISYLCCQPLTRVLLARDSILVYVILLKLVSIFCISIV